MQRWLFLKVSWREVSDFLPICLTAGERIITLNMIISDIEVLRVYLLVERMRAMGVMETWKWRMD